MKISSFVLLILLNICFTSSLAASTLWGIGAGGSSGSGGDTLRVRPIDAITGETGPEITITGNGAHLGILDLASDPIRVPEVVWSLSYTQEFGSELLSFNPHLEQMLSSVLLDNSLDLKGLAIDPTTGQFYAASPTTLYQINPITGEATLIGQTTFDVSWAISFDMVGNLFGGGILDMQPMLISINKVSAEAEVVGPTGSRLFAIAARPEDGVMYVIGCCGEHDYILYQIDLTTGSLENIGPSLFRPGGLAFTGIPEPTTLALFMIAITGYFHRRLLFPFRT